MIHLILLDMTEIGIPKNKQYYTLKAKDIFIDVTITGTPLTVNSSQALSCVLIFTTTCQFFEISFISSCTTS